MHRGGSRLFCPRFGALLTKRKFTSDMLANNSTSAGLFPVCTPLILPCMLDCLRGYRFEVMFTDGHCLFRHYKALLRLAEQLADLSVWGNASPKHDITCNVARSYMFQVSNGSNHWSLLCWRHAARRISLSAIAFLVYVFAPGTRRS